ncbi:murein biosynthesis integral membrane protein MurJ [Marinivivus vitaminiproducens]|uniref:murein biosynthesis integral membrane protein MurJ n=1 Tax=Marinivivus vitaminiproducens TaxID=3035935 RepID=UPI0027A59CC1|nr:murein biosynthesis integral membrane protein MurJ [Geminicoccaceae bacterium SCSIO 64248]
MALLRAAATIGSLTMVSRVVGLARDMLVAAFLGAGPMADAFVVAFKLPNFLRRLFAEGAFSAGFVPLFAATLESEGKAEARRFAAEAQAMLAAVLIPIVVLAIVFMPAVLTVVAPGYEPGSLTYETAVELSRITFPYIIFISAAALLGGVLNSVGNFAAPALAPVMLNVCLIAALFLALPLDVPPAYALAWGIIAAGITQFGWLYLSARRARLAPYPVRPRLSLKARRLYMLILPGVFGASVAQINLLADVFFASFLPAGGQSYLYYANQLNQLPLGVIGVAVGTALLPLLARQIAAGQDEAAQHNLNRAIELSLFLTLPAAVALVAIGHPIVAVLFERGAFDASDTAATVATLQAYALGLPAFVLIKVLAPGFFARQDTRTPVIIATACLLSNIALVYVLIGPLLHVGIALASAISNSLNAVLLAVVLARRGHLVIDARLRRRLPRILLAGAIMGLGLWGLDAALAALPPIASLIVLVAAGFTGFVAVVHVTGGADLREVLGLMRRRA